MITKFRAGVLGKPIAHSLSPVLHTAAYAALGLADWEYTATECDTDELADLVSGLGPEWRGLSLTMPLKRVALDVADSVSDRAERIGAANTLVSTDRGWHADNTDAPGMVDALGSTEFSAPLILGAGGTAQAAIGALSSLGVSSVAVAVRDTARAGDLVATAERFDMALEFVRFDERPRLEKMLGETDLLISTLPKGAADDLTSVPMRPTAVVFDVVYDPWPTPLVMAGQKAGARIVSGLDLLLHQAAHQVRLMTGLAAPVEAMRAVLPQLS